MPKRRAASQNAASGRRFAGASSGNRRAAAIGARMAARYPYAGFGRMYVPKGTATQFAGESYRAANAEQRAWRKANNFSGVGGFWGSAYSGAKRLVRAHGAKALGYLGGELAGPAGAVYGHAAGRALGMGSYDMGTQNNSLVHGGNNDSMSLASVNPSMSDDSGDVIMSHSEFIGNVVATVTLPSGATPSVVQSTFQNTVYPINPGLQASFPFLCQLAQNYTMYKLQGCMFQYKPTSGEGGGSSNQLGKLIMATDYDPMAEPFINSVQMENYQYSQSTKPSLAARHGVETAEGQGVTGMKYVRTGTSTRDKSFTDYGLFQVATEGIPINAKAGSNTVIIGELWVSYKIRLSRANLYSSLLGFNIKNDIYDLHITGDQINDGTLVIPTGTRNLQTNNIGTTIVLRNGKLTGEGITRPDSITIKFPSSSILGTYKISVFLHSADEDAVIADVGATYTTIMPLAPSVYTSDEEIDQTEWGCAFYPLRNGQNYPRTYPKIDLSTGLPVWSDTYGTSDLASPYTRCLFSEENLSASPSQCLMTTYFSINSPATTVAKLCLGIFSPLAHYPNDIGNVGIYKQGTYGANCSLRIMIEQVNSEITNAVPLEEGNFN